MKKYYDLYKDRLLCELEFEKGANTDISIVKRYLKNENVREVSKAEYDELEKDYCSDN